MTSVHLHPLSCSFLAPHTLSLSPSGLGHVTCIGQQEVSKWEESRGLKNTCPFLLPPCFSAISCDNRHTQAGLAGRVTRGEDSCPDSSQQRPPSDQPAPVNLPVHLRKWLSPTQTSQSPSHPTDLWELKEKEKKKKKINALKTLSSGWL